MEKVNFEGFTANKNYKSKNFVCLKGKIWGQKITHYRGEKDKKKAK